MPGEAGTVREQAGDVRDLLLRITREMVGAENLDRLLQTMVDAALLIVPAADKCVIHLLDDRGATLQPRVCSQPSSLSQEPRGIPADVGIAGRALRERAVISVGDTMTSPDFAPLSSGHELRSLLVAPLYVADVPLGTLSLSSSHPLTFSSADSDHIRTLAAQASVAIRQANLLLRAVAERSRSEAIINSITDGLVILDGTGRIVGINPALHGILELQPDELSLPCALSGASPCPERLRVLLDPCACQVIGPYELALQLPSTAQVTLRVTPSPLVPPARGEVRAVHVTTHERAVAEARASFISSVTHELRRPLQHMMGYLELLETFDDGSPEERQGFLRQMQEELGKLAHLVDDLGQLSRIETGRFTVDKALVRLDTLVAEAVAKFAPRAQNQNITLGFRGPSEPIRTLTDAARLEQVLGNLVDNALKFVPSGGKIEVAMSCSDQEVLIEVADSGPGIPPEALPFIFDRFYQVQNTMSGNSGMGLGLYISREIVQALGGRIWVESRVGRGSTFSFSLPRLRS